MAGTSARAASGFVIGGLLCIGLVLFAIAAAIILSLIPIYTADHGSQGYGSVYTIDSFMLKFFYTNSSGTYFSNGTVANSTDLSQRCTSYFQSLGYKNFAGCLVFSGRAWGPTAATTTSKRRRRETAGLYFIGEASIYRTVSCPSISDKNKTENSTSLSYCNKLALEQCNMLVNDMASSFSTWTTSNPVTLDITDTSGYSDSVPVSAIYGVPRQIAYTVSGTLSGVSAATRGQIQNGCRYVGALPLSTIDAILASQTSSVASSATTQVTG